MRRALTPLAWLLVAVVVLAALAGVGVLLLTRTPWGVERVGRYVVTSIGRSVHGRLSVARIRSGRLLRGVTLHDLSIVDSLGRPFLHVDSVHVAYGWLPLLRGQIVLTGLDLYHPVVDVEQLPGDSLWNYERIFMDTSTTGTPRLVQFSGVTVHDGQATIAYPFDQKTPILPGDTARMLMRRVEGGLQRVLLFQRIDGALPSVLWETPEEPGRLFKIDRLSGLGYVWSTPFLLEQAAGTLAVHDSVVAFDARDVRLPSSQGAVTGRVVVHDRGNAYDIKVAGRHLAFDDLHWLYPKLPKGGAGSGTIRILTVPRGTLWLLSDARLQAPGTRLAGSFGIVTGDTLYFTQVNLRASPFDLKVVQSVLPGKLPIQGLLVGTVVVQGPLSALQTHGDLRLSGAPGDSAGSQVKWSGTVDLRRPFGAREFRADIGSLDLALLSALDPTLKLRGSVSGRIDATGRLDQSVRLVADLQHALPGATASHLTGSGDVTWTRQKSSFDLQLQALPVALDAFAQAFPALRRLEGNVTGPVTVKGSLNDLQVNADLQTPAGQLAVGGHFDLASRRPAYHAAGQLTGFRLSEIVDGLPPTTVTGAYTLDGSGKTLADADATASLDVRNGRVGEVPLRAGTVRLSVHDGLATVDTVALASAAGTVHAQGAFGLRAGRAGTLDVQVEGDSLAALQPFFFSDTTADVGTAAPQRLGGRLHARATLTGGLTAFDVSALATLERVHFASARASRAGLRLSATGLGSAHPAWRVDGDADTLRVGGLVLPATTLRADYGGSAGSIALSSSATDGASYAVTGDYHLSGDTVAGAVRDLRFGTGPGSWRLVAPSAFRAAGGALQADSLVLARRGGGGLRASGQLAWARTPARATTPVGFDLRLDRVPVEDFWRLAAAEPPAGGRVSGRLAVTGTAGSPRVSGEIAVDSGRFEELRLDRVDTRLGYADGRLDAHVQAISGGSPVLTADGRLPLDLAFAPVARRVPNDSIQGTVRADSLPASLATTLLNGFSDVKGRLDGTVQVGGTVRAPRFNGEVALKDGAGWWQPSGVSYTGAQASFRMAGDGAIAIDASARAGSGRASATGRLVVGSDWTNPGFDLTARLANFWTAHRREADVTGSGTVHLGGRYRAPLVTGALRIDNGVLFTDEIWRQYNIVALDDSLLFNVVDTTVSSVRQVISAEAESDFMRHLAIDTFTIDVGQDGWLRGRDMNVEVAGSLQAYYRRATDDLRLTGQLRAVRGTYLLIGGRRFDVRGGTIEFIGTSGMNPLLDISAVYKARTCETAQVLNIEADVTGTLENPRIGLTSDATPALSQSDLMSCLMFGVPSYRLSLNQTRLVQTFSSSFLGVFSSGLESMGRTVGLDYVALSSGETYPRGATNSTNPTIFNATWLSPFAGTRIDIGRYVGDRFFLAVSGGLSQYGTAALFRGARLEWRIRPSVTGEFFVDDRAARLPSFGYTFDPSLANQKVYGFFLYREWGY